jgi:hypothetical protein
MLALAESWKEQAKELEWKALQIEDPYVRKLMIMQAELLVQCATDLIKAYLQGLD